MQKLAEFIVSLIVDISVIFKKKQNITKIVQILNPSLIKARNIL